LRSLYMDDGTTETKMSFKISAMKLSILESQGLDLALGVWNPKVKMRVVWLMMPRHGVERKADGGWQSRHMAALEDKVRSHYKAIIPQYVYDIICFGAGDHAESIAMSRVFEQISAINVVEHGSYLRRLSEPAFRACNLFRTLDALDFILQFWIPSYEVLVVGSGALAIHTADSEEFCVLENEVIELVLYREQRAFVYGRRHFPDGYYHVTANLKIEDQWLAQFDGCNITDEQLLADKGTWTIIRTVHDKRIGDITMWFVRPELVYLHDCLAQRPRDIRQLELMNELWRRHPHKFSSQLLADLSTLCPSAPLDACREF